MNAAVAAALMQRLYAARYFRAHPVLDDAACALLEATARDGACLPVFLLWGVNEKPGTDDHDSATMRHLAGLLARIETALLCRAAFTLVLCDSHGELNCADPVARAAYARAVLGDASARGWAVQPMSTIWRDEGITLHRVDQLAQELDVARMLPRLDAFAARHYRGGDTAAGARRYLAARLLEKPALERRFRHAIHLTPVEPALALLQPDLPTFHIWTERKGCSAKPWFATDRA